MQAIFAEMKAQQFNNLVLLPYTYTDKKVSVVTREFNLLFILSHIYKHIFFEGIDMRQLVDYYYVLRQCEDGGERERTVKRLKSLGMMRFTRGVMFIMKEIFGLEDKFLLTEPNKKDGTFLLYEIMRSGNFGILAPVIDYRNKLKKLWFALKRNARFIPIIPVNQSGMCCLEPGIISGGGNTDISKNTKYPFSSTEPNRTIKILI